MRGTTKLVLLALSVAIASVAAQASAAGHAPTSVRCSWQAPTQGTWYSVDGTRAGPVTCSAPLGTGRYHARYRDRVTPPTASETASPRLSFQAGTVEGRCRISGTFLPRPYHYHGIMHVSGGTGRFEHVTGTLRLSCTVRVSQETCRAIGSLTGI
jgi:hypothetical protein